MCVIVSEKIIEEARNSELNKLTHEKMQLSTAIAADFEVSEDNDAQTLDLADFPLEATKPTRIAKTAIVRAARTSWVDFKSPAGRPISRLEKVEQAEAVARAHLLEEPEITWSLPSEKVVYLSSFEAMRILASWGEDMRVLELCQNEGV